MRSVWASEARITAIIGFARRRRRCAELTDRTCGMAGKPRRRSPRGARAVRQAGHGRDTRDPSGRPAAQHARVPAVPVLAYGLESGVGTAKRDGLRASRETARLRGGTGVHRAPYNVASWWAEVRSTSLAAF